MRMARRQRRSAAQRRSSPTAGASHVRCGAARLGLVSGPHRSGRALFFSVFFFALALAQNSAQAVPNPRILRAPAQRILSFDPPGTWERAPTPPSSRLLATWAHRDAGRLTIAAQQVGDVTDAAKIFDESRASLERQGWSITHVDRAKAGAPSGRVTVDASLDKGKRIGRQLYLVEGGFVYVITLVAPQEQAADRLRDFDDAVASLKLGDSDKP